MSAFLKIILFGSILTWSYAQDWQTITTMNNVHDLIADGDKVWAASDGGLFSYQEENNEVKKYTNISGMKSILNYAINADDHGQIISGGEKGVLDVLDIQQNQFTQLYELQGNPIHDIFFQHDSLWVAAGKGVAVYVWEGDQYEFKDYFTNFKVLPSIINTIKIFAGKIWLGTDVGLFSASADLSRAVLNNPEQWTIYKASPQLPDAKIKALAAFQNALYIGTSAGLSKWKTNGSLELVNNWVQDGAMNFRSVQHLVSSSEYLFLSSNRKLYRYNIDGPAYLEDISTGINSLAIDKTGELWAGLEDQGIYKYGWDRSFKMDGPGKNLFAHITKASDGSIWVASRRLGDTVQEGHFQFNGKKWINYSFSGKYAGYLRNSVSTYQDRFGNIWISTYGSGVIEYTHDGSVEFFHNYPDPGFMELSDSDTTETISLADFPVHSGFFIGAPIDTTYEVITAIQEDRNGRLWFANWNANSNLFLASAPYTAEGFVSLNKDDWVYFGLADGLKEDGDNKFKVSCIEFDIFGRAWIGTLNQGIYILDFNNTVTDKSDDEVYTITMQEDFLYSNSIYSLKSDDDGVVWIGTAAGLNSYDGVNVYKHVGDPSGNSGPLENRINQIFVDSFNNKWFATSGGLSILKAGYSPWEENAWQGYNTDNSGLVADEVFAVTVDPASGEAYIGTNRGMSIYKGTFAEIRDSYEFVASGPNPYFLDGSNTLFTIKNLQQNTTVKIFTINGRLIRTLAANEFIGNAGLSLNGSRAYWDGRDRLGNLVGTGVYLYAAYTLQGKSTSGKIAVIRK